MKLFDMHCDIGTDIFKEGNTLKGKHIDRLYSGEVLGVFTACFFNGKEDWETMQNMVINCNEEIKKNSDTVNFAYSKDTLVDSDKLTCMISVEGMCGLKENAEESIDWLYKHNVRVGSLVWNEQNALAAGWKRDPLYGVTDLGKEVIKAMNKRNMVIDVSHINEKGFWDIIETSTKPVIATHSNARALCNHPRNLTDQQILAIAKKGGVMGLNACGEFVNDVFELQDVHHLALHAKYMCDLIGDTKHVGCGFDFMDFLDGYTDDEMTHDMNSCTEAQKLVAALKDVGFTEDEVKDICFYNVFNFLKENID